MKDLFTKDDINNYLSEINDRLCAIDKHGSIIMAGGAVLTTLFNARESTRDIDGMFQPSPEMRKIISDMANAHNLPADWLNDGVKGFLTDKMDTDVYKEFSNLSVYTVNTESLLAMKLISARPESWDLSDSVTLMKALNIRNIEEVYAIVEKRTVEKQRTINSHFFIQTAFAEYEKLQVATAPPQRVVSQKTTNYDTLLADAQAQADVINAARHAATPVQVKQSHDVEI